MFKLKIIIKSIAYLCSVVLPVIDALKGVKAGIKAAKDEAKYEYECKDIYTFVDDVNETTEEDFKDVERKS